MRYSGSGVGRRGASCKTTINHCVQFAFSLLIYLLFILAFIFLHLGCVSVFSCLDCACYNNLKNANTYLIAFLKNNTGDGPSNQQAVPHIYGIVHTFKEPFTVLSEIA